MAVPLSMSAEAHRRWRGERSKPGRLGVRDHHTRSLCAESPAQTEQWCCWLCRRRNIFGRTCARGRGMRDAGRWSELRIPGIAAQTRMVSLARIRLVSRKSPRIFKRIVCDDVSEIAVGTLITERPPHRSVRAQFGHTAPTLGV